MPFTFSVAQELNCTVTVNYEGLAVNNRELLIDFGSVVESYPVSYTHLTLPTSDLV